MSDSGRTLSDITRERYEQFLNPGMATLVNFMGFESAEVRGEGCYVHAEDGSQYLDFWGGPGVFNMGHAPEKIVARVREQLEVMPLSSHILLNPLAAELAERLSEKTPGSLQYSFFGNSGAEAVEGALKVARAHTGRPEFVSTQGAFHGKTFGALTASGRDVYRDPFQPLLAGFTHVPFGDVDALADAVTDQTAAFIVEPIQGEGGVVVAPDGYLARAREICDEHGALLILDEIQSGMGRSGKWWSCQWDEVEPDILTMGKALGGGVMPIGALIAKPEIWDIFEQNPYIHTSTFGGNPLACAAALGALEAVDEMDLCARAAERGEQLIAGLHEIAAEFDGVIADVRGRGLFIGVEFTDPDIAGLIIAGMSGRTLLAAYTRNNPSVIRFEPPLIVSEAQADEALNIFRDSITDTIEMLA